MVRQTAPANPNRVRIRRYDPMSGHLDPAAIPDPFAIHPHVIRTWLAECPSALRWGNGRSFAHGSPSESVSPHRSAVYHRRDKAILRSSPVVVRFPCQPAANQPCQSVAWPLQLTLHAAPAQAARRMQNTFEKAGFENVLRLRRRTEETNAMNANAATQNSDMKISYRRSNDARHSNPLFVMVSKFVTDSFPVRMRYLRLGQTKVSETSSGAGSLEQREIPPRQRQGKVNCIDVVPKSLNLA